MCGKGRFLNVYTVPLTHIYPAYTAYVLLIHSARLAACPAALVAAPYIANNDANNAVCN